MPIFDLGPKFDGLSAFCDGVLGAAVGSELFGEDRDGSNHAQGVSRLRAGTTNLTIAQKLKLSAFFNDRIARATQRNTAAVIITPDMWEKPLSEFFTALEDAHPAQDRRLINAHAAILETFTGFDQYRDQSLPLALTHAALGQEIGRFPDSAVAVDPIKLPPVKFIPGETMTIEIAHRIEKPSIGWLFFVRNPDLRLGAGLQHPIWRQQPADLIRWMPSPFLLAPGFLGALPGFPSNVGRLEGQFTTYLLIEDAGAKGVRSCLEDDLKRPWNPAAPAYEATLHLLAVGRRLFQQGNVSKSINYAPPRLLMRRYEVRDRAGR